MILATKRIWQARYNKARNRAAELEDALDALVQSGGRKTISFDSGEGKQTTTYESPIVMQDFLERQYKIMETAITKLSAGGGLVNINMRRQNYIEPVWTKTLGGWNVR